MRRLFWVLAVLIAVPCFGGPFEETLKMLGQPTLGADATHLDDVELQWGHATVRLSGDIESVVAAGGAVGFAFEGTGRLEMTIPDGPFRQAVLTSLDDEAGWKPSPDEPAYGVGFRSAVFFTDRHPERLDREGHVTSAALAKVMTRTLERWTDSPFVQPDHALAAAHFEPRQGDRVIAFLWDGPDDLLYRCDGISDHEERLGRWKKISGRGISLWITETLIQQPVAFDPRVRPIHDVTQTAIDLELVSPDNEMVDEHVVAKVKDPFIALSCGKTVRRWKEGEMNCLEAREERPLAFPFVVVGDFEVHETDKGGYHLNIYSYAMGKERGAKNLARNGVAILDFYSNGMLDFLTTKADEKKMKVTTEDVIQFANAISGRDLRPWFDRYVYGTEVPPIDGI